MARDTATALAEFPSEVGAALSFPLPLWERGRVRGSHELRSRLGLPLSPTLPRKGGGSPATTVVATSKVSTPLRLPPPLRGRVGRGVSRERGTMTVGEMVPHHVAASRATSRGIRFRLACEQAAPLSPTLPRKGGGSPATARVALHVATSEVGAALSFPLPLWERGRVRGSHEPRSRLGPPLTPTLSHRKSGLPDLRKSTMRNRGRPWLRGRGSPATARVALHVATSEVSTPLRLPPPLRGRVGRGVSRERGTMTVGETVPHHFAASRATSRRIGFQLAAEQAAPLSPTLPRKGGGSPATARVALHDARAERASC
ncbi:hypothetical protein CI1B_16050 [Bradyrhizobium ivorense]|uniref:Uncharacterized protein n=1 Tax=Bradyrhizobium ivorense TaxID=2511166 RepID=A0A508SVH9_9BRAD|nr:hypothetical protein CI1B_16050 [Bradyrhizobium ivorense]